jgi:hypothetical protein
MGEQLKKLRPDRDLQCYFKQPSAVAALSGTSQGGFTVSGCWRDPSDWAIVEWNRDNVFEHPALRNLPDGDLSGVKLSYQEVRSNCVAMDSSLYPTVEWPYLRIWAESAGMEKLYDVPLNDSTLEYAMPVAGSFTSATVTFQLQGVVTGGDYIELAWLDQHFNYPLTSSDSLQSAAAALAGAINEFGDGTVTASASGTQISLAYNARFGANANRIGVYGTVHGAATETWSPSCALFSGGASPQQWEVNLDFSKLVGYIDPDRSVLVPVPTSNVRKMRWTWAADLQAASFQRSEFSVVVTNWAVAGNNLLYQVAGPGSRRLEDDSNYIVYSDSRWNAGNGNFSGGSIHWTTAPGCSLSCSYTAGVSHTLYLGTRYLTAGGHISVKIDSRASIPISLALPSEDVLVRIPIGTLAGGAQHTLTITHDGVEGTFVYFDFLEIAVPANELPDFPAIAATTLATDWDTEHSIALAPERTAWLIQKLGFCGRANHYAGARWFYELWRPGQQFASATITFSGVPEWGKVTSVNLAGTIVNHVNLIGDTAESVATCFALLINSGSNSVWAHANGTTLTITARNLGTAGNGFTISASSENSATNSSPFTARTSAEALAGGVDGTSADPNQNFWRTDLAATPRINRAARDWSVSYFKALKSYGIDATAAFSMELQHGEDDVATGMAQRYPNGDPVWLTTPSLQTNFGPASTAFWQQVYLDMATLMDEAGIAPYLQFGEVQWWYFPGPTASVVTETGLPYYDTYTTETFQSTYGRSLPVITRQNTNPGPLAQECSFLSGLIGTFSKTIREFVLDSFSGARFEVLYPPDVNDTALNQAVNFPISDWTPSNLACLKTENFTYTGERNMDKATQSIQLPARYGFPPSQSSHLVGIGDYTAPWQREEQLASGAKLESVVLFALDQFCLIGYGLPLRRSVRRARFLGRG